MGKYNHGHKVDQWREKHKLAAKMKYKRMLKKEQRKNSDSNPENVYINSKHVPKAKTGLSKAREQFSQKEINRKKKKEEFVRKQAEKAEAIQKYKEKKNVRLKVLNSKTKRGQPVMAGRMELLLAKIQEQCQND